MQSNILIIVGSRMNECESWTMVFETGEPWLELAASYLTVLTSYSLSSIPYMLRALGAEIR